MNRPTRQQQKQQTRTRLLEVAREAFVTRGIDAVSAGAISKAAGVAHGTFYVHFADKDAVVTALLADFNDSLTLRLAPLGSRLESGDVDGLLREAATLFLQHWADRRDFVKAFARHLSGGLSLAAARDGVNEPAQALLAAWLERWKPEGRTVHHPHLVVQGLLALWARLGMQATFRDDVDTDEVAGVLVTMTHGAVRASLEER